MLPISKIEGARELSASTDPIHPLQLQRLYLFSILYNTSMPATKRLAVTEPVWSELSELKKPGETFSQLLAGMIEREKKARLIEHLMQIAEEGDFVELPP